jgi:hypothetical protein
MSYPLRMSNDSKPEVGATVMMTVQPQAKDDSAILPVLTKPKGSQRVIFAVALVDGLWTASDPLTGDRQGFMEQRDALLHARTLARAHWSANNLPCGVSLDKDGVSHMAALYGAEPQE